MHRALILFCLVVTACFAQDETRLGVAKAPIDSPERIFAQLTLAARNDTDASRPLQQLGLGGQSVEHASLIYEDLDGDGSPEALLTTQQPGAMLFLTVAKRSGKQWYRAATSEQLSCWCKYESDYERFVQIVDWKDAWADFGPARLVILRESGGGTGLYVRKATFYALRGFELRRVLSFEEERRECDGLEGCALQHAALTFGHDTAGRREIGAVVLMNLRRTTPPNGDFQNDSWYFGQQPVSCTGYEWSAANFEFKATDAATKAFCDLPRKKQSE